MTRRGAAAAASLALGLAAAPAEAASTAAAALGPDAAACAPRSGQTALIVDVSNIRARTGSVRVSLYGADPDAFLARGQSLRRVDLAVPASGPVPVCIAIPDGPGLYAIAVRHDENGNGRTDLADGGGFSNNPPLSLFSRPVHADVAFPVRAGVQRVDVRLAYVGDEPAEAR